MGTEHVIAFNVALLAAMASPGPAFLVALRATLANGRAAGVATGFGLGTMAAAWTLAALLGLDAIFALFPWAYTAFKTAGALYLLYIAWATWRGADTPITRAEIPGHRAFLNGVLVNLANPKAVLFAGAVLLVVFPPGLGGAEKALIVANHLVVEWAVYAALALLLSREAMSRRYLNARRLLDRAAASLLGALGLKLLTDR